ncbi:MAG: tRNA (adenosine(37)-N6)-dimethylallyltransferase MiaA [Prevotella sp.]|nr:tRNA (adenosine(37)-N6)-dimethylallyltransferase MiaA [Prevotella sp.]
MKPLITIIGPTASGKTTFAAHLAQKMIAEGESAEIISGDSRQVYRGMTIGTGKDLDDYTIEGITIPYHLIDICDAGEQYNIYRYQQDFRECYNGCLQRGVRPILCGGSGLYIESVINSFIIPDKKNEEQRQIRHRDRPLSMGEKGERIPTVIIGLQIDRELRREKITLRLKERLEQGMVEEIKELLKTVPAEKLIYYGLEYKYVTEYVIGTLTYEEMFSQLEIAIHQFAKRQMTWYRGMQRRGMQIHWIEASLKMEEKVSQAMRLIV